MVETFFSWPIFSEVIFPFVLVFTLIFSILEKTKILGENRQNHAIISLAIGLILIATPARMTVAGLIPFFAILAVVLLIFMLLWGFVLQDKVKIEGSLRTFILIAVIASVIVAVMVASGYWADLVNILRTEKGVFVNLIMIVLIGLAAFITIKYAKSP